MFETITETIIVAMGENESKGIGTYLNIMQEETENDEWKENIQDLVFFFQFMTRCLKPLSLPLFLNPNNLFISLIYSDTQYKS